MRADARRNYERLLSEARTMFAEDSIEASLEEIARRAGVGIGTLYRHFPTRDALLEALLRDRFDTLAARARALLEEPPGHPVLFDWSLSFVRLSTAYRGLTAALLATLRDETSDLHASCEGMRIAAGELLRREQKADRVRSDVDPSEFLALVHGAAWGAEQAFAGSHERLEKLVGLVIDGLTPTPSR
jgi:AcrR family transcriptional regulator